MTLTRAARVSSILVLLGCHSSPSSELVWQIEDQRHYTIAWADITLTVDPAVGGRITSLRVRNREMITGPEQHPVYYGSTLWLSPQDRWWPEPPAVDTDPYLVRSVVNPLTMISRQDSRLGLQIKKSFLAVPEDSSLHITYTAVNRADTAQSLALWEVTRMKKECEIILALDSSRPQNRPFKEHVRWSMEDSLYRTYVATDDTIPQKSFNNATGWVIYARDSLFLLKRFPDLSVHQLPPGQGEVEIYIDDSAYVEVEEHSEYRSIASGDSLTWTVRWYPRYADITLWENVTGRQYAP